MYRLGFIQGYSRDNTIRFSTLNAQTNYFVSNVDNDLEFDDAYYPPHYTNKIKINVKDYSISNVNFLMLNYNNKWYYYFIDQIKYINEYIAELSITMDTIQTFMFDVKINYGNIERLTIPRWRNASGSINRDYIRENISKGEFILNDLEYFTNNKFLVVIRDKYQSETNDYLATVKTENNEYLPLGVVIAVIPLPYGDMIFTQQGGTVPMFQWKVDVRTQYYNEFMPDFNNAINNLLQSASVANIYLADNRYINSIFNIEVLWDEFDEPYGHITVDTTKINYSYFSATGGFIISQINQQILSTLKYIKVNNEMFVNNRSQNQFNIKYHPQIIDDNYMQLLYGERKVYSTYPLFNFNSIAFHIEDYFDFYEDIRGYHICSNNEIEQDGIDKYDTWAINNIPISFNLINNAWANYAATHKASLSQGRDLAYSENNANMLLSMLRGSLTLGLSNAVGSEAGMAKGVTEIGMAPVTAIKNSIFMRQKYKVADNDLKYTPNTIGQGTSLISDITNGSIRTVKKLFIRSDIEAVIKYFETYGYRVNKFINNTSIYDLPKNRYYYNFYKFSDIDIKQTSAILTVDIISDIEQRLINGIRFFENLPNTLEINYAYDNYDIAYA